MSRGARRPRDPGPAGPSRSGNVSRQRRRRRRPSRAQGRVPVLRRILLAASDSGRMRQLVTSAPVARGVVARYVAGDAAAEAVAVAGRLHQEGLLVTLDHLGEDTGDARHAEAAAGEYTALLARPAAARLTA